MPDTSLIGLTLAGRFRLTGVIGEGGMATVYRGVANGGEEVAIKIMNPELAKEVRFVRRFRREAKAASILSNPNIVEILEFGVDQGYVFLAMELLRGFDLAMLLHREKRIGEARAVRIVAQVCRALSTAHKQSIVHRDLKPDNIMLVKTPDSAPPSVPGLTPQDFVKVLDFGIAKILDDDTEKPAVDSRAEPVTQEKSMLTRVGTIVGTPAYMAPEQGRAEPVDARTDIYACGVLLYELITGRVPFLGETPMQVVMRHVNEPPRPPSDFVKMDTEVEKLILRALAKYPVQRQQSAEEMEMELLRVLAHIDPTPAAPQDVGNRTLVIDTGVPDPVGLGFPTLNIEVPDDIFPSAVYGAATSDKASSEPQTRRVETPTAAGAVAAIPVVRAGVKQDRLSQTMQSIGNEETSLEAPRPNLSLDDDEEAATMVKAPTDMDKADQRRMSLAEEAMARALKRPAAGEPPAPPAVPDPPPTVQKLPKPGATKPNVPSMSGPESVEPTLVAGPTEEAPKKPAIPVIPPVPALGAAPHPHEKTAVSEPSPPAPKKADESSKIRIAVPAVPATLGSSSANGPAPKARESNVTLGLAETMRVDVEDVQRALADGPTRRPTSELVPITMDEVEEPPPKLAAQGSGQADVRSEPALWSPAPQKKRLSGGLALVVGIAIGAVLVALGLGLLFLLQNPG